MTALPDPPDGPRGAVPADPLLELCQSRVQLPVVLPENEEKGHELHVAEADVKLRDDVNQGGVPFAVHVLPNEVVAENHVAGEDGEVEAQLQDL